MKKIYSIAGITWFLVFIIIQMVQGQQMVGVQEESLKHNILHERKLLVDISKTESRLTENLPEHIIPVVPNPQEVKLGNASFTPVGSTLTLRISGVEGKTREIIIGQLAEAFFIRYGKDLRVSAEKSPSIWIGIPGRDDQLKELVLRQGMVPGQELGDEGYILQIGKNHIYILANNEPGAFYGVQTLKLLLRGYPDPMQVPEMTIRDWPAFSFRCVMDDISRGPIPSLKYMQQQVRRYAELKINLMSFYIEHVVRTKKYPDFAPSNGGIPVEEFRELSDYAADYQIKLVGNFQSLGHFEKILSFPQYRHLGASERMLDPLNPNAITFLVNIYREMAPAFSSEFFTPNCDEAWDLSRGKLNITADSLSVSRIYADHVTRIDSVLRQLGKRTIIWGDIIWEHPEILEMIPGHIVVGVWDYSPYTSFASFIDPVRNAGFEFTVSPGVLNSNRLIPDYRMTTTNIRNLINEGYEKGAIGVYCTVWDDGGMHFFSHDWYGVAFNAEHSWRPNQDPLEEFDMRFSRGIYGDMDTLIPRSLHTLNKLTDLSPTYEMNSSIFLQTLVPERGEKITFDTESWTEVSKWAEEAGDILSGKTIPFYNAELSFIEFTIRQYRFLYDAREELLRASDAYNHACEIQLHNKEGALRLIHETRDIIDSLKYRFEQLTSDFEILWDMENRPYWRQIGLLKYQEKIRTFTNQMELLEEATRMLEAGNYLPSPAEVRLDIRLQPGQYFPFWLMVGSFTVDTFEKTLTDFLTPMGGEANARPYPGMSFNDQSGKQWNWISYDAPKPGEINLGDIFKPDIRAVAYAYCTIETPVARHVTALLGSNDGANLWCNGQKVYEIHTKRSLIPDEDEIILNLEQGKNHILIKVEQWKADWGFSFRMKDADVRNHKQKYYIHTIKKE
jgi:hypothetical protein